MRHWRNLLNPSLFPWIMSSGRLAEVRTPLILSILMVLMTQVGYLDLMNAYSGSEETLDEVEPVVAHSPATSVMHGNNTMWVSGANGPVQNRGVHCARIRCDTLPRNHQRKTSMNGCPMAYNASNATVWQPNTGATTSCAGSVKHYVGHDRRYHVLHLLHHQFQQRKPVRLQPGQRHRLQRLLGF